MIIKKITLLHEVEEYKVEKSYLSISYVRFINYMFAEYYTHVKDPIEVQLLMYDMLVGGKRLGFDTDHARALVTDIINEVWECELSAS